MIIAIIMIVLAAVPLVAWGVYDASKREKEEARDLRPVPEILMELILRKMLEGDVEAAIALFCAYRGLTMPDRRGLVSAMAAEVDRRYGSRVPWPEELRFHAKLLLDEYVADGKARIHGDIQSLREMCERRKENESVEAQLAMRSTGW
jgi:hypothetical protein